MKERRFKIGLVSDHLAAQLGKDIGEAIKSAMPDDAVILKQESDIRRGCIQMLIHHSSFDIVPDMEMILARVVENGGTLLKPVGPSWRGRSFTFADPDGNEMVVWSESGDGSGG